MRKMTTRRAAFILVLGIFNCDWLHAWDYFDQDSWGGHCQSNDNQSPISIPHKADVVTGAFPIVFVNYDVPLNATIKNNGHSVVVEVKANKVTPSVKNGALNGTYILSQLHFHWDAEHSFRTLHNEEGYENKTFPLEAHFVHHEESYESLEEALQEQDGVVVLATFYKFSLEYNDNFNSIVNAINYIHDKINETVVLPEPIILKSLLSASRNFYTYQGSLTTPPCTPTVKWVLFPKPSSINEDQRNQFNRILGEDSEPLLFTQRDLQKIRHRQIQYYDFK